MANNRIRFGPAGNSDSFYAQGHKHTVEAPAWLHELGLSAFEYSFGRGVNLREEKAAEIGAEARKYDIALSVHAPYYINFANESEESRLKSRQYIYNSARVAKAMGAGRIVVHTGASTGRDRREALLLTLHEMEEVLKGLDEMGLGGILLCPETMGKPNQQGTVDEIMQICALDKSRFVPTLDFGHINALEQGSLKTKADFERIIDRVEAALGQAVCDQIHVHFSHIEYGKAGEVRHLTFEDETFGPPFEPLADVLRERHMNPVLICESKNVMAEDALKMKVIYEKSCC